MSVRTHLFSAVGMMVLLIAAQTHAQGVVGEKTYDPPTAENRGQAGMVFLNIGGSARVEALGGAATCLMGDPAAVFYNPASAASIRQISIHAHRTQWFDDMSMNRFVVAVPAWIGSFGVTMLSMDYGDIPWTRIDLDADDGTEHLGNLETEAWSAGLFGAFQMTDRFSFGIMVKYVREDLGSHQNWISSGGIEGEWIDLYSDAALGVWAIDLGTQYNTGIRNLMISMSLQNFAKPQQYVENEFDLPLTYRVGVRAEALEFLTGMANPMHNIVFYADGVDGRDFTLDYALGVEYTLDMSALAEATSLSLRAGRRAGNTKSPWTFGAGFGIGAGPAGVVVDYGYGQYGFGLNVHHIGVTLAMR